jgi:hypothetical protein
MRIAGLVILLSAATAFADPVFLNLGAGAAATDVSTDGLVVVGTQGGSVFRWTQATGMTLLGTGTEPRVSADGSAMSWQGSGNVYRWTSALGPTVIGAAATTPAVISGDGSTVAWGNQRWSTSGWSTTLQPPAGTSAVPQAYDLNFDGSVAVGSTDIQPCRWDGAGQGTSLGSIPGYPVGGTAKAVTPDGQTVVGYSTVTTGYDIFRWRAETGMVAAHSPFFAPVVNSATSDGEIAVGTYIAQAFAWRDGFGTVLLNDILHNQYGIDLHNFDLEYANGISGDGRTLVGYGWDYSIGANHQFAWYVHLDSSIPGPGSVAVLVLLSGIGMRRRR